MSPSSPYESVKFSTMSVPVHVEGGVPRCPDCHEPMVEVQPQVWQCPDGKAIWDFIGAALARALDREIFHPPAPAHIIEEHNPA